MKPPIIFILTALPFAFPGQGFPFTGAESTAVLASEVKDEALNSNDMSTHHGSLRAQPHHEKDRLLKGDCQPITIDFGVKGDGTPLKHGDYVSDAWFDAYGMMVEASSKKGGYTPNGKARIFDTTFTPSEDPDLNSPNEDCPTPGPGVGAGGAEGETGANCNPKGEGNVLIIQESDSSKPNDNADGGTLSFLFKKPTEVLKIGLMDLEPEPRAYFRIYREGQSPLWKMIVGLGDNSIQDETIAMKDVKQVALHVSTSVGIRFIELCLPSNTAPLPTLPTSAPTSPRNGGTPEPTSPSTGGGGGPGSKEPFYFASVGPQCDDSGGLIVNDDRWPSHRFEVTETIITRKIEGVFSIDPGFTNIDSVTMFGAITRLTSANDYPNDANLLSCDVVATTTLTVPVPVDPVTGGVIGAALTVKLEPGWYSLTFGTNAFGASSVPQSSTASIIMENCGPDYYPDQLPFTILRDEGTYVGQLGSNPLFIVTGWWQTDDCGFGLNNVDVRGQTGTGWWHPDPTIGLALVYTATGSYELNFQFEIPSYGYESCREKVQSVLLTYTGFENPSENREECINAQDDEDLFAKGIFRFAQGFFIPALGSKRLTATTYFGPGCQIGTAIDYRAKDFQVAYGLDKPDVLLIRADNGAEICRLDEMESDEYVILNLAKLPPQLNIRAVFDMGRGLEGRDQLLPGTSVRFIFANDFGIPIVENIAPFAVGGDDGGEYFDFSDTLRKLIGFAENDVNGLTVEAMSEPNGGGISYTSVYVAFRVVDEKLIHKSPACSIAKLY